MTIVANIWIIFQKLKVESMILSSPKVVLHLMVFRFRHGQRSQRYRNTAGQLWLSGPGPGPSGRVHDRAFAHGGLDHQPERREAWRARPPT